ncbi:MAG: glycosyltransferase family 39 protein [Deltaproteobacteria bacterium]|nr:glycosyltransferase family 39 protein [Deltaproteobacteria bacterium]
MQYRKYFIIYLTSITIFRLIYIWLGPLDLSPDEAHYWEWSRRLDLSYYSKGPVIAYLIAFFTAIGGNNEFSVRLGAVLISIFVSLLLFVLTRDIFKSERAGFYAAILPALTPLYSAGAVLMTIDAPFILFWGLAVYVFRRGVMEQRSENSYHASRITHHGIYWYLLGIIIGLGLLTKYTMALIYPCIFLFLLLSKTDRFWLKRKEPYVALILSIVVFSPVIIWNIQHDWVTVRHTLGQAHISDGLKISLKDFAGFVGSQFGVITPFIFIGLCYGIWKMGGKGFKNGDRDALLLFLMSAPILFFFLSKSIHAKVQANWAAPAYFTAFIAAGGVIESRVKSQESRVWLRIFLAIALITGGIITIIAHDTRVLNIVNINNDPANRLVGWEELGRKVGVVYNEMHKDGDVFIFSDSYQIASELAFYVDGNPVTYNVNLGRRMNQYDIWQDFDTNKGKNAVYVKNGDAGLDQRISAVFLSCEKEPLIRIYRGSKAREFSIFKCYGFNGIKNTESGKW